MAVTLLGAGLEDSAVQLGSNQATGSSGRMKVAKAGTADDKPRVQVGVDAAVQAVNDKTVLVDSFNDANQFFIQVKKTQKPRRLMVKQIY